MQSFSAATPFIIFFIGGTFWFAYNHPNSYYRVANWMSFTLIAAMGAMITYEVGYRTGAQKAFDAAKAGGTPTGFEMDPVGWWGPAGFVAASLVIFGLRWVHLLKDK